MLCDPDIDALTFHEIDFEKWEEIADPEYIRIYGDRSKFV